MTLPQRKKREALFLLLYEICQSGEIDQPVLKMVSRELKISLSHLLPLQKEASEMVNAISSLDEKIHNASTSYDKERILSVELCVLRLLSYEVLISKTISKSIAIAEAVRLSKKFSSPESTRFVHGVLNRLFQDESLSS